MILTDPGAGHRESSASVFIELVREQLPIDLVMHVHYHGAFASFSGPVMRATFELESTLTDRYQTTVPGSVRRALRLGKRDKIRYLVQGDGTVVLTRGGAAGEDDPVLAGFLQFLASDLASRPGRVRALDRKLAARIRSLVKGVKVKLDEPLDPAGD